MYMNLAGLRGIYENYLSLVLKFNRLCEEVGSSPIAKTEYVSKMVEELVRLRRLEAAGFTHLIAIKREAEA